MDALGDRMKGNYENRARHFLTRRTPVIVRVDGKAFHTFARGMDQPFDEDFIRSMATSASCVSSKMQGFKLGYVQSDEASFLLTDDDGLATDAWFDNNQSKIETVTASTMTATFIYLLGKVGKVKSIAAFDGRAFNIPMAEVANYFLWRAQDWHRNSVSMYCRSFFSAKQMHGKSRAEQHEMLHSIGKNWATDLSPQIRNGTFIVRGADLSSQVKTVCPAYAEIEALLAGAMLKPEEEQPRKEVAVAGDISTIWT